MKQLQEARKLAKELYDKYESPFKVVDILNDKFEGLFYMNRGNIFRCLIGSDIADLVYDKRCNLLED